MNEYRCTQRGTVRLAERFVEDAGEHSRGYARWIEGTPQRGPLGCAKRMGRPRRQAEAFRFLECAHLQLFAAGEA